MLQVYIYEEKVFGTATTHVILRDVFEVYLISLSDNEQFYSEALNIRSNTIRTKNLHPSLHTNNNMEFFEINVFNVKKRKFKIIDYILLKRVISIELMHVLCLIFIRNNFIQLICRCHFLFSNSRLMKNILHI